MVMAERKRTARAACRILLNSYTDLFEYQSSFLLKKSIGNFVEGLLIENTLYEDTFCVWSIICPTWHLSSEPKLDYGDRLLNGNYFAGDAIEISEKIVEAVSVSDVARRRCCGPPIQVTEFFSTAESGTVDVTRVDVEAHNNLGHIFDKAVLLLLHGDILGGCAALDVYHRRGNGNGKHASVATGLIAALKAEDGSWLGVIRDAQREGREAMALPTEDALGEE